MKRQAIIIWYMFWARAHNIFAPELTDDACFRHRESKRQSVMNNTKSSAQGNNVVGRADCSDTARSLLVIFSLSDCPSLSLSASSGALEQECSCNQIGALWPWLNAQSSQLCVFECARTESREDYLAIRNPGDALCGFTKENERRAKLHGNAGSQHGRVVSATLREANWMFAFLIDRWESKVVILN